VRVAVIVPVSPYEPVEILVDSARCLRNLDFGKMNVKILYVIDLNGKNDSRAEILKKEGVEVLERESTRGKRAGAINDALKLLESFGPEYIAIFDVDSRPAEDFVVKCINALEKEPKAYIASSPRYISNDVNLVSSTVSAEYLLINFLLKKTGFRQFNGLIGVLRAEHLFRYGLKEDAIAEDADFATRMHAKRLTALLIDSAVYEQAPLTWWDLLEQRRRWYYGGLQLWKYWEEVKGGKFEFVFSWIMALTLTYFAALFLPFILLSPPLVVCKFRNVKKLPVSMGLLIHALILQYAAIKAMLSFIRRKEISWKGIRRSL